MKTKVKKKSKHDLPSLDFVTALSIEECREQLLLCEPQVDNSHLRRFVVEDDQHFTVEWLIVTPSREYISLPIMRQKEDFIGSVKYQGSLLSKNHGTHVRVVPIQQPAFWSRVLVFFILPVIAVLIVLATLSYLDLIGGNSEGFLILLMIFVLTMGVGAITVNEQTSGADILIRQNAREITDWLYNILYIPPEKIFGNNEGKS